jgi:hypothetical protein
MNWRRRASLRGTPTLLSRSFYPHEAARLPCWGVPSAPNLCLMYRCSVHAPITDQPATAVGAPPQPTSGCSGCSVDLPLGSPYPRKHEHHSRMLVRAATGDPDRAGTPRRLRPRQVRSGQVRKSFRLRSGQFTASGPMHWQVTVRGSYHETRPAPEVQATVQPEKRATSPSGCARPLGEVATRCLSLKTGRSGSTFGRHSESHTQANALPRCSPGSVFTEDACVSLTRQSLSRVPVLCTALRLHFPSSSRAMRARQSLRCD